MKRITEVFGKCDDENLYGTASALLRIRDELEKSGEVQNPEALDYFAQTRLENMMVNKLGKHEDIEENLGIDLITLSKCTAIWFLMPNEKEPRLAWHIHVDFYEKRLVDINPGDRDIEPLYFYFKDYGKTWALTPKELKQNEQSK